MPDPTPPATQVLSDEEIAEIRAGVRSPLNASASGYFAWIARLKRDVPRIIASHELFRSVAFKLARHIRNTDSIGAMGWSARALEILAELRSMDADGYDRHVKQPLPAPPTEGCA